MSIAPPIPCAWDGESFAPLDRFAKLADKHFVIGEVYPMVVEERRSMNSHRHFFASLNEAHRNLPEDMIERLPTVEHLRKYALIHCGYADERTFVCASKAEAIRLAAFVKPMDSYAIVIVRDNVVKHFTAQSQSTRAMGAKVFGESKQKVLDFVAQLIGVSTEALADNAKRAA